MAAVLAGQAEALAGAVREALGTPPGGDHGRPWVQTGALQGSIGYEVKGLQAAVGSSDPAAAPEIVATVGMAVAARLRPD